MAANSRYDPKLKAQVCGVCGCNEFKDTIEDDHTNIIATCCKCGETNIMLSKDE